MSWLTLANYKTWATITTTDATRDASLTDMLAEVEDAIYRVIKHPVEVATYTRVLDGPPRDTLNLPYYPVSASGLQVWFNEVAKGDPSLFTSDHLLTRFADYDLKIDQPDGTSRSGELFRYNRAVWAYRRAWDVGRLAPGVKARPGCVKVTWTAGYATVPPSLLGAGYMAVAKLYAARKLGAQATSASLNGASYSLPAAATADGVLGDPTIKDALLKFSPVLVSGGN